MILNSTVNDSLTIINENDLNNYDYTGAMVYIIAVLFWYSIGIIFMLAMQMRARSETIEDSARHRTKLLIRSLRKQSNTKEILEELVDKKKRARLWDIYLGVQSPKKDKLTRAESIRIRHIEKQLATINRNRRLTNETLFSPDHETHYYRSRSDSRQIITDALPIKPSSTRRRSSFDHQTIERWKALSTQSKTYTQIPWTTRKLIIEKYFHHQSKKRLSIIHQESTIDHINILSRHRTESDLNQISINNERQNPYLTYFYTPTDHPSILTSQFFAVSSDHLSE